MPSGPRIRTDNVFGTLTDNPLSNVATTMNSAGLANLAAVSSAHAVIVLDPLRAAGAPEIVFVTAHTGAATSATIVRGGYGTSARQHASGVLWVHAPTVEDAIRIVTSSTRPSDPYEGQLVYETDLDRHSAYNGSAWETISQMGAWTAYTPTVKFGATTASITNNATAYLRRGREVVLRMQFEISNLNAGTGNLTVTIPFAVLAPSNIQVYGLPMGSGAYVDGGTGAVYPGIVTPNNVTDVVFRSTNAQPSVVFTHAAPNAVAATDEVQAVIAYEAAS